MSTCKFAACTYAPLLLQLKKKSFTIENILCFKKLPVFWFFIVQLVNMWQKYPDLREISAFYRGATGSCEIAKSAVLCVTVVCGTVFSRR